MPRLLLLTTSLTASHGTPDSSKNTQIEALCCYLNHQDNPPPKEPQQRSIVLFSYLSKSVHKTKQSPDQEKCTARRSREPVFWCFSQSHYPITKGRGGPMNLGSISIPQKDGPNTKTHQKNLKKKNYQNELSHTHKYMN
ncbi:hypothetical protein V8G54_022233 [Vigna mungo]|uniref:Secreted protein n=1 Tax=Vigna mungo TaxID=3915 RepID=A0AAQ3NHK8_VIGMU